MRIISALAWPFMLSAPSLSQSLRNFDITSRMTSPEKQSQNNAQKLNQKHYINGKQLD
jgi:hypothetical protein